MTLKMNELSTVVDDFDHENRVVVGEVFIELLSNESVRKARIAFLNAMSDGKYGPDGTKDHSQIIDLLKTENIVDVAFDDDISAKELHRFCCDPTALQHGSEAIAEFESDNKVELATSSTAFTGEVVDYSLKAAASSNVKQDADSPPTLNSISIVNNEVRIYFDTQHCPLGRGRLRLFDTTNPSAPVELATMLVELKKDTGGNWRLRKPLDTIFGKELPKCPVRPVFELIEEEDNKDGV